MFIETFGEACEKTGWLVDAWVLMSNHYHLVLRTPQANLVAGMRWLQNTYTRRFNVRNQLWGHVFQIFQEGPKIAKTRRIRLLLPYSAPRGGASVYDLI